MNESYSETRTRLHTYALRRGRTVTSQLGWGWDGVVLQTTVETAIKGFRYRPQFERERDVYIRLLENQVEEVCGFVVPRLEDYDDELMVVEMEIVSPPYVIDFAGARIDSPPDFPPEVIDEWTAEKAEQFEEDWPRVWEVVLAFQRFGIFLGDVHPGNIRVRNDDGSVAGQ
jgi:hypothetical protein